MATHLSSTPFSDHLQQIEDVPLRFPASTFGKFLEQAREEAAVTREAFVDVANEIISKNNERLPKDRKAQMLNPRIYGNLERNERFPTFEELEPLYQTFSELLPESFSSRERERYIALAQVRFGERRKRPKKGYTPTVEDWHNLQIRLASFDAKASQHASQKSKAPYLLPVPSAAPPQIRLSTKVVSLLNYDTSYVIERDRYVEEMMRLWDEGKRLIITKAISGTGKTRAFYLLLKHIARMQNRWPFYYALSSSSQMPDDHLDNLLSLLSADLHLSSPEDEHILREERMEQIFMELAQCSKQGLRLAVLLDDVHLMLDPSSGTISAAWQHFFDCWIARDHTAVLCLATREWPYWKGRDRSFLKEIDLEPLSPEGGATIWKRFGFEDVPDTLLEEASRKCGGYPQWIELRASDLDQPGHQFLWPRTSKATFMRQSADNQHTKRLKAWLAEETIFDLFTDAGTRDELTQVFSRQLSFQVQQVLDLLAASPLGIPFPLLEQEFDRPELALDELVRRSLVDRDSIGQGRAALVSLAREARLHQLSKEQREQIEQRVTDLYMSWLYDLQQYQDDAEQAALIAELIVLYIKQGHLLNAAELLITYGWLCVLFGHIARIQRMFDEYAKDNRRKTDDVEHEVGRLLLLHRISVNTGQKLARSERDRIYQSIYDKAIGGEISLQPHAELEVLQNMLLLYIRNGQLAEASQMFERTFERLHHSGQMMPEVYAAFLFSKARLMSSLSEQEEHEHPAEALQFIRASADALKESVANWRQCLKSASPLQETYVKFKLARALNDFACDLRTLGQVSEAEIAIEESIQIKRASGALPHSLAISLSEYSQILTVQGKIRQAQPINEEGVKILEHAIENGDTSHNPELGMLLGERANIFWQQARFTEAKPLLERAVELIGDKPSRQKDKNKAIAQLKEIELITSSSRLYQFDQLWFPRFSDLVDYDDLDMLTQAGPFTEQEQAEWDRLSSQEKDDRTKKALQELMAQSRKREFSRSLEENRTPILRYPCIPLHDVQDRISGLTSLHNEIETQETNAVVRRLYLDAIDEHLMVLHLCEATILQNQEMVKYCNLKLYDKPSLREFKIALQQLCNLLLGARDHGLAGSVAQEALAQLKAWDISPQKIVAEDLFIPKLEAIQQKDRKLLAGEKKMFPATVVCKFFQDALVKYGEEDWDVSISPARDQTYVDTNAHVLVLPQKSFSVRKIRQLLAEEIETHVYRAIAGQHSSLALLGSGLAHHIATDEGLAHHYVQHVNQEIYGEYEEKTWNGTLTTGLAAGLLTPALSFQELRTFLEKMFLVNELLTPDTIWEEALAEARQSAWRRSCRTFRGVPDLDQGGCCSLKDRIYLSGYLDVSHYLEHGEEQRLYVGCIGIDHLEDMAELNIPSPNYQHQRLALAADLAECLAKYER